MYAYTSSPVMRGVLDLFIRCEAVLPNLYIGTLTRDTVSGALLRGLAADELLTFLASHAHPRAAQRPHPVPEVTPPAVRWSRTNQSGCRQAADLPDRKALKGADKGCML